MKHELVNFAMVRSVHKHLSSVADEFYDKTVHRKTPTNTVYILINGYGHIQ